MTQSKDTSAKEFDALFRSLEERYQMGELAILRALASIDSNDSDPPKKKHLHETQRHASIALPLPPLL